MSRGNGRMAIFLDDLDYRKFLYLLGDVVDRFDVECWDFCVMTNHYHLTLCNRRANLSDAVRYLNGVYAFWWNAAHDRVGHVFQGRFKDQIVQREGYLSSLCRYIALNPVRAKLVEHPADWQWSSYRTTAGIAPNPGFLHPDPILRQFGTDQLTQRQRYVQHVLANSAEEEERAERLRSKERILGDREFKASILEADAVPPRISG
jgi:putative transposase